MQPAVLIRLRPAGPWRYGPGEGGHDRVDTLYRSDRLYSAVTLAMRQLGYLDEWLDATVRRSTTVVAFTSLFPYQGDTLFVPPPATLWPPPSSLLTTPSPVFLSKIRWKVARFVPVQLVESLLLGQTILADQWAPDPDSGCLLRRDRPSTTPYHVVIRSAVAVDRISQSQVAVHTAACVEFEPSAGLWTTVRYTDEEAQREWGERVQAAFRLLADSGFGGKRSSGWGQTEAPQFQSGSWPGLLFPKVSRAQARSKPASAENPEPALYWLLSLYSPIASDSVDWRAGSYEVTLRGGRVDNSAGSGAEKKHLRMIVEGSVLSAVSEPAGAAVDVAPDDFAHPVYRSGFALALKLPSEILLEEPAVETPSSPEALEPAPCDEEAKPETSAAMAEPSTEAPEPSAETPEPSAETPEPSAEVPEASPELAAGPVPAPNSEEESLSHEDAPEKRSEDPGDGL